MSVFLLVDLGFETSWDFRHLHSLTSWNIVMLTGQDQSLYLAPKERDIKAPFLLWLERPKVETRLFGNRSCYRERYTNIG